MSWTVLLSEACNAVDGNISTWGACIQEGWFFNSPEMMGISVYVVFAIIIYKARLPLPIILAVNVILSYLLATVTEAMTFELLFVLSVALAMGAVAIAIVERFWK